MKRKHSEIYKEHYKTQMTPYGYVMSDMIKEVHWNEDCLVLWQTYKRAIMQNRQKLLNNYPYNLSYNEKRVLRGLGFTRSKTRASKTHVTMVCLDDSAKIGLVHTYTAYCLTHTPLKQKRYKKWYLTNGMKYRKIITSNKGE